MIFPGSVIYCKKRRFYLFVNFKPNCGFKMRFARPVPKNRIMQIPIGIIRGHVGARAGMTRATRPGAAV
ncbi:hypothetical protein C5Q97_13035 [Victivallales bacterium CCUG 44730]|nr:hypothetical protein C5Q97_13035 [Victivallales bacterium CCUG 44730]